MRRQSVLLKSTASLIDKENVMSKKVFLTAVLSVASLWLLSCGQQGGTNNAANKPANAVIVSNSANANTSANPAAAEADIKKLITDYAASTSKNDAAAYDKTTTDNFMFVSNDGTVQTKAERIASMRSGETKYESLTYDDVNVRVNPEGDAAIAIGKATVKGTNNGKPLDATVRVTQVWSKTRDGWKMASLQATNITAGAPTSKTDDKKEEANKASSNK
jgi:ketosteroid isomerase-like protein